MEILYILKHNPWGIGGGCYACRNYLELFTEIFKDANFDVLICEEYTKDMKISDFPNCKFIPVPPRNKFAQYLSPITHILHRHQQIATKMLQQNHYDYCIFDHNSIAGSLIDVCKKRKIKTVVLNHNCEVEYFKDNNSKLKNILLLPSVRKNEQNAYLKCDYNIFLTEEDKETFQQIYGPSKTHSIVGGCFLNRNETIEPNITPFNTENPRIVISGTIGNVQNLDGINYFLDKLYPTLPYNVQIIIAGKNPPVTLIERIKHYPNIQIIPNPKDILSIIRTCDIFLCPTRLGGGMKLRIMDGLRCCLPVLTHKVSARGYKAFERKGYLYQFENEQEFSNAFHQLIKFIIATPNLKKDMAIYNENITFEEKIKTFKVLFTSCTR